MQYLEDIAVKTAKNIASGELKVERKKPLLDQIISFALKYEWIRNKIFDNAKEKVMKMSGGLYPAPLRVSRNKKIEIY